MSFKHIFQFETAEGQRISHLGFAWGISSQIDIGSQWLYMLGELRFYVQLVIVSFSESASIFIL